MGNETTPSGAPQGVTFDFGGNADTTTAPQQPTSPQPTQPQAAPPEGLKFDFTKSRPVGPASAAGGPSNVTFDFAKSRPVPQQVGPGADAANAAMEEAKNAAGVEPKPGILSKLKNWAFRDVIPSDAVAKVATALVGAGQPVYDERGNVRFYRGLTNEQLKEALVDPSTKGDMSNVVNVPGVGLMDVGVLDAGIVKSASGNLSGMTKPAMIATFGASHVARGLGMVRELFLGEEGLQTAATELEGAEAVHAAAKSDVQAALAQAQKAEQAVQTAEQALAEGKTTEEAVTQARNVWSEQAANLRKAQEAVKNAAEAQRAAASTIDKVVDNIHRISTTARGTAGRALGTVQGAVEAGQQVAGKGMLIGMLPDIVEGRREGETPMDALERRATALGWSLLGGAELGAESKSDLMNKPISEIPESLRKDVQRVRDWANERAENKAKLQQAISVEKIKQAVPSKGRTQYTAEDMDRALAHAEEAKADGEKITNLTEFRDAVEEGRQKIEDNLAEKAEPYKDEPLVSKPEDSVKNKVAQKLDEMAKVDGNFAGAMDSLAEFNITDPTVSDALALITKLNNYQRAAMKGANNFDIHQMIETNPEFAARFFLADELRNALHNNLEGHGVEGSREARLETASLAKVRDALGAQINANRGGTTVRGTGASSALQGVVAKLVGSGIRGAAVAGGAEVAGPAGAVAGGAMGEPIAQKAENAISPRNKTRDSLIEEAFKNKTTNRKPAKITGEGTPSTGPATEPIPPAPKPVAVEAPKVPRENTDLHAELAALYDKTKLENAPYKPLEDQLRADVDEMANKKAKGQPLTEEEKALFSEKKKLLKKILSMDATDAAAEAHAKKTAEEKANAVQAEKTPEQAQKEEQQKAEQVARGERPVEINPVLAALGRGDESGLVDHTNARKAIAPATTLTDLPPGVTSEMGHRHEWAHHAMDAVDGEPLGLEIWAGTHEGMDEGAAASATFDRDKRIASFTNPDGSIDSDKAEGALVKFVSRLMAGPAGHEVFDGWTKEQAMSHSATRDDVRGAREAIQTAHEDWTPKQVNDYLDEMYERARKFLTQPHIADRIKANAAVREEGLPQDLHASRERVSRFQQSIREAHNEHTGGDNTTGGAGNGEGGKKGQKPAAEVGEETNARGNKGGRGQELRGGNEAGENARGGTEVKSVEKAPINAAEEEEGDIPLVTNEYQTPKKMKYEAEVTEGGQTRKTEVEAHSHKQAMRILQKANPTAEEWHIGERTAIPNEEGYTVPNKPHLSTPTSKAAPETVKRTMRHELGHYMVGHNEGIPAKGVLRHTHPEMGANSIAAVDWDTSGLADATRRQFKPEARPGILRMLMGGIAADEAYSNVPRGQNINLDKFTNGSDGRQAYQLLRTWGFDHDTANAMINEAIDRAKEHLTKPAVRDVIEENADVREPNLSTQYHFSPERLKAMGDEAARRLAARGTGEGNEGTNQGPNDNGRVGAGIAERGAGNVAGREGEGARANAERVQTPQVEQANLTKEEKDTFGNGGWEHNGKLHPIIEPRDTHLTVAQKLGLTKSTDFEDGVREATENGGIRIKPEFTKGYNELNLQAGFNNEGTRGRIGDILDKYPRENTPIRVQFRNGQTEEFKSVPKAREWLANPRRSIEQANLSYAPMKGLKEANESQAAAAKDAAHHENDLEWQAKYGKSEAQLKSAQEDYNKEHAFAGDILAGKAKVEDFPYFDSYKSTIANEAKLLPKGGSEFVDVQKNLPAGVRSTGNVDTFGGYGKTHVLEKGRDWADIAAKQAADQGGGFTIDPKTGKAPTSGYMVELFPERRTTLDHPATADDIRKFAEKNKDVLAAHPELHVGGYNNELNIAGRFGDLHEATRAAKNLDQISVWDVKKGEEIPMGGNNRGGAFPDYKVQDRLSDLEDSHQDMGGKWAGLGGTEEHPEYEDMEHLVRPAVEKANLVKNKIDRAKKENIDLRPEILANQNAKYKGFIGPEGETYSGKEHEDILQEHGAGPIEPTTENEAEWEDFYEKQQHAVDDAVRKGFVRVAGLGMKDSPLYVQISAPLEDAQRAAIGKAIRQQGGVIFDVAPDGLLGDKSKIVSGESTLAGDLWRAVDKVFPKNVETANLVKGPEEHTRLDDELSPYGQAQRPERVAEIRHRMDANIRVGKNQYEGLNLEEKNIMSWDAQNKMDKVRDAVKAGGAEFSGGPLADGRWNIRDPKTGSYATVDANITPQKVREALAQIKPGQQIQAPDYSWNRPTTPALETANLVKGSSVPLMNQPLDVKPNEGREEPNTLDVTKALNQFSRKQLPALEPGSDPKEMTDRAKRIAADEAKYQLAQAKTGTEWYTTEMKDHDKAITDLRPELLTGPKTNVETPWNHTAKMTLFKAAEAILSSGQKPYANVKSAIRAWDLYRETGEFPPVNPETGKSWGPRNVNAYGNAFGYLNRLIKEKGEQGAADWLLSEHTVKELRDYNPTVAGKMADTDSGAKILGEKRGPFMQNLHGIESKFTADMWVSRSWNRWMGTLELDPRIGDKGKVTSESDTPRNNTERALMKESFAHAADKLGLTTSSLQAVLWYYEQALYRAHGLPVESWSFSDAAKRVANEKNATEGQTDFKFGANEGEPEAVGGVPKPAGKAKGGAVHAFDLINAFKGNK